MTSERRHSPRIEILGKLHGQIVAFDVPVTVTEISLGGLTLQAAVPFPVGAIHDFRLTLGDGSHVILKARVAHSNPLPGDSDPPVYQTGVQFIDDDSQQPRQTVTGIIKKIQ